MAFVPKGSSNVMNQAFILFSGLGETEAMEVSTNASGIESTIDNGTQEVQTFGSLNVETLLVSKKESIAMTFFAQENTVIANLDTIAMSQNPSEHYADIWIVQNYDGATPATEAKYYQNALITVTTPGFGAVADVSVYETEIFANSAPTKVPVADIPLPITP